MEPLPRTAIFVIVCSWSLFMEFPFGPSSLPTKLNWNKLNLQRVRRIKVVSREGRGVPPVPPSHRPSGALWRGLGPWQSAWRAAPGKCRGSSPSRSPILLPQSFFQLEISLNIRNEVGNLSRRFFWFYHFSTGEECDCFLYSFLLMILFLPAILWDKIRQTLATFPPQLASDRYLICDKSLFWFLTKAVRLFGH